MENNKINLKKYFQNKIKMNSSLTLVKKLFNDFLKLNVNNFQLYATAPAVGAVTKGAGGLGGKLAGSSKNDLHKRFMTICK